MVKNAIRRLVLRYFPELGQRKHLPQLARIEKIYDMPVNGASVSSAFRGYKAADIQLLDAVTGNPLAVPVFEQVSIASGQGHEHGLFVEPTPGMQCLIQYIDGLDSLPVITSLLPWHTLVPDHRSTDVSLQQSHRTKLIGSNGDWQLQTDGEIKQASQKSIVEAQTSEQHYHERSTKVATHDINKIDGNQVNEIMGALKILVGEKAIITSLDNLLLGSNKEVKIQSAEDMHLDSAKSLIIKAKNITEDADTIKLNGGTGVINCASICPFMGKPHVDGSTTVFAGK
ncbi:hypothetical protein ACU5B6_08420 [Moritella viscosa]|uniref:hypothetical protein n=1 Tax=Moritella viscosa TaxID=80854 RepID=UPI0009209BE1|nr:hypothetical protein [Moritella viscosa]SHO14161.1 Putative uncharacterized protein [Moritella viscosa]SHO17265.1 Putative uncharacterized protein [Moritella viscosa]SHO18781.1 Putative uncharacterized protein [Moritella viscosa]